MIPTISRFRRSSSWPLAVLAGLCVIGAALALWRYMPVRPVAQKEYKSAPSFITIQKSDDYEEMTREQSMLLDSAPLFLPTRWSTTQRRDVEYQGAQTDLFEGFSPEITLSADRMKPVSVVVPVEKIGVATTVDGRTMSLAGRPGETDSRLAVKARAACYEVYASNSGKVVITGVFEGPLPEAGDLLWQPAEFWVRIVQEGMMGPPLITSGSGSDSLDASLRRRIVASREIVMLPPGYYRVVVGP